MDDAQPIIGLPELLSEIVRDLQDFRAKHQSDYGVKNITLWWELERERLTVRHGPGTSVRRLRVTAGARRLGACFLAGGLSLLALQVALRLLVP
jgi:hypothetical protein